MCWNQILLETIAPIFNSLRSSLWSWTIKATEPVLRSKAI